MNNTRNIFIPVLLLLVISGCSLVPDFSLPEIEVPKLWDNYDAPEENIAQSVVISSWWKSFGDKELDALVEVALKNNYNIKASIARIKQARAGLTSARASLFPSVSGSASASASNSLASETSSENSSFGASASYEVDLFGANRAAVTSSEATFLTTKYAHEALKISIAANVVNAYFAQLSIYERLQNTKKDVVLTKQLLELEQQRFDSGRTSYTSLSAAKTAYASAKASRATLEEQYINAYNALAILLAEPPKNILLTSRSILTHPIPGIEGGIPATILTQRPDIAQAENTLISANADIGAARAAFFPSLNLSPSLSVSRSGLMGAPATTASISASVAQSIFSAGVLEASLESAKAEKIEQIATYRQTILEALEDVENAFANRTNTAEQMKQSLLSLAESEETYSLAVQHYSVGNFNLTTLIQEERSLLSQKNSTIQSKVSELASAVSLYQALGGGFERE